MYYSNVLAARIKTIHYIRSHFDELQKEIIKAPIFVVGLPRTGTTITFNLLAGDPNFRFVRCWQALTPTTTAKRSRIDMKVGMRLLNYMSPKLKTAHEMELENAEECTLFLQPAVLNFFHLMFVFMPGWYDHIFREDADFSGTYLYHKYILQILQHRYIEHRKDGRGQKRWILKTPAHLPYLEYLVKMYPDASIIWTHRNPKHAVPSTASLIRHFWGVSAKSVEKRELGEFTIKTLNEWLDGAMRAQKKIGKNMYDVYFEDIVKRPEETIRKLYDKLGWEFKEAQEKALKQCVHNGFSPPSAFLFVLSIFPPRRSMHI